MNTFVVGAFLALGGMALLWKLAKNYIPLLVDKAGDWLVKFPKVRAFILSDKESLKEVLRKSGKELEKDIDSVEKES